MILDKFMTQAEERHGRKPEIMYVTPRTIAAITSKGETVPEVIGETKILCAGASRLTYGDSAGERVAVVVEDCGVMTSMRLVDVA